MGLVGTTGPTMEFEKSHLFMIVALIQSVWCMIKMVSPLHQKNMGAMEALKQMRLGNFFFLTDFLYLIILNIHFFYY